MPALQDIRAKVPQYDDLSDADFAAALRAKYYPDMPAAQFNQMVGLTQTDKYRQAAEQEFADLKAKGVPVEAGLSRRVAQGATLGAADEILAGLQTPLEMVKRGTLDPREAYRYAKARENVIDE